MMDDVAHNATTSRRDSPHAFVPGTSFSEELRSPSKRKRLRLSSTDSSFHTNDSHMLPLIFLPTSKAVFEIRNDFETHSDVRLVPLESRKLTESSCPVVVRDSASSTTPSSSQTLSVDATDDSVRMDRSMNESSETLERAHDNSPEPISSVSSLSSGDITSDRSRDHSKAEEADCDDSSVVCQLSWQKASARSSFPNQEEQHSLAQCAKTLIQYISNDCIRLEPLDSLTAWLNLHLEASQGAPEVWNIMYLEDIDFWDQIGFLFHTLVVRDEMTFSKPRPTGILSLHKAYLAYFKIASRLLIIDADSLRAESTAHGLYPITTGRHLHIIGTIFERQLETNGTMRDELRPGEETGDLHSSAAMQLVKGFLFEGVDILLIYITALVDSVQLQHGLWVQLLDTIFMISKFFEFHEQIVTKHKELAGELSLEILSRNLMGVFPKVNSCIETIVDVPMHVLAASQSRTLICELAAIIRRAFPASSSSIKQYFEMVADGLPTVEEHLQADFIYYFWRLKQFKLCFTRGKMELRVMAIDGYSDTLIEMWKAAAREKHAPPEEHPLVVQIIENILNDQVLDYLVGEQSHPLLISRSANISGLLIAANRFSEQEADIIWHTVANSPNPRAVAACLDLLSANLDLMSVKNVLYFCNKLLTLSSMAMTPAVAAFWRKSNCSLVDRKRFSEWSQHNDCMAPYRVCVKFLKDTFSERTSLPHCHEFHQDALLELTRMIQGGGLTQSQSLFAQLNAEIQSESHETSASTEILLHLVRNVPDHLLDAENSQQLLHTAVANFIRFIGNEKRREYEASSMNFSVKDFAARLDFVIYTAPLFERYNAEELLSSLLDSMVGPMAISNKARNAAWNALLPFADQRAPAHDFLTKRLQIYLLKLEPDYYVQSLVTFLSSIMEQEIRAWNWSPGSKEATLTSAPWHALLWHVLVRARWAKFTGAITDLLVRTHEQLLKHPPTTFAANAHQRELAKDCLQSILTAAPAILADSSGTEHIQKHVVEQDHSQVKREFSRTITFLRLLVHCVRSHNAMLTYPVHPKAMQAGRGVGEVSGALEIRYKMLNNQDQPVHILRASATETREQLHAKLSDICLASSFATFLNSSKLDLLEDAHQTLGDMGSITEGVLKVKPDPKTKLPKRLKRCAIEMEILENFSALHELLNASDEIAEPVFDLLTTFPVHASTILLKAGKSKPQLCAAAFSSGQFYNLRYSLRCLAELLATRSKTELVESGLARSCLDVSIETLQNTRRMTGRDRDRKSLDILAELMPCFLHALTIVDLRIQDPSEAAALLEKLVAIMSLDIDEPMQAQLACDAYNCMLRLVFTCPPVWKALQARTDTEILHNHLLFAEGVVNSREFNSEGSLVTLRSAVASLIKGEVCKLDPAKATIMPAFANWMWNILAPLLARTFDRPQISDELFDVANAILHSSCTLLKGSQEQIDAFKEDLETYFLTWVTLLMQHAQDLPVSPRESRHVVSGLAQLLNSSLEYIRPQYDCVRLSSEIFSKFLFTPPQTTSGTGDASEKMAWPILESETRGQLYRLIQSLAFESNASAQLLTQCLTTLERHEFSQIAPVRKDILRDTSGIVGILNLGNTCYMNALLTQLYMNVNFRRFILNCRTAGDHNQKLLLGMQMLFSEMQHGFGSSVNAREIAEAVKTFDGECIDVLVQMDVEEFQNLLMDQLEAQIAEPDAKARFRSFYGGQLVNQIKSVECEHISERLEACFSIQCEVKGKSTLHDSLRAYVGGDMMEGDNKYKCESCGGKFVNAMRRTCLKEVPNDLVFHLKRFDYDISAQQRSKINDQFEFPMRIDVSPFKLRHLEDPDGMNEADNFDLVGVLLHKGVAEQGHYFSHILRQPSGEGQVSQWYQFDDADVTQFDPIDIPDRCFGGFEWTHQTAQLKSCNAYMLFYRRTDTVALPTASAQASSHAITWDCLPPECAQRVQQNNEDLVLQYNLLAPDHLDFVQSLLEQMTKTKQECSDTHETENRAIFASLRHFHELSSRSRETGAFEGHWLAIQSYIGDCLRCRMSVWSCISPLQPHEYCMGKSMLIDVLIRCSSMRTRTQFAELLMCQIKWFRSNAEFLVYGASKFEGSLFIEQQSQQATSSVAARFAKSMAAAQRKLHFNPRSWDDFFQLLCDFTSLGLGELATLLDHNFLRLSQEVLLVVSNVSHGARYSDRAEHDDWQRIKEVLCKRKKLQLNRLLEFLYVLTRKVDLRRVVLDGFNARATHYDEVSDMFSIASSEMFYFQEVSKADRHHVLITSMIDAWKRSQDDHTCFPALILERLVDEEILQHKDVYDTVSNGLGGATTNHPHSFLFAASVLSKRGIYLNDILEQVALLAAEEVEDAEHGERLLKFYEELCASANGSDIFDCMLATISQWGPALLLNSDVEVRSGVFSMIHEKFFAPTFENDERVVSGKYGACVRQLLCALVLGIWSCFNDGLSRARIESGMLCLDACKQYLQILKLSTDPRAAVAREPHDASLFAKVAGVHKLYDAWYDDSAMMVTEGWQSDDLSDNEDLPDF